MKLTTLCVILSACGPSYFVDVSGDPAVKAGMVASGARIDVITTVNIVATCFANVMCCLAGGRVAVLRDDLAPQYMWQCAYHEGRHAECGASESCIDPVVMSNTCKEFPL